jgi:hypothetical protein
MPTSITSSGITFDDTTTLTTGVLPTANIANGAVTPAKLSQPLTLATSVATTSGTSIDFTGIPSWAKRITVMLNGVSTGGSSIPILQIGDSGGIEATGYTAGASDFASYQSQTTGFPITRSWANTFIFSGIITIAALDSAANTWVASGSVNDAGGSAVFSMGGAKSLSATLDRVRLTTVNGTDTFDAGSVNIIYEG